MLLSLEACSKTVAGKLGAIFWVVVVLDPWSGRASSKGADFCGGDLLALTFMLVGVGVRLFLGDDEGEEGMRVMGLGRRPLGRTVAGAAMPPGPVPGGRVGTRKETGLVARSRSAMGRKPPPAVFRLMLVLLLLLLLLLMPFPGLVDASSRECCRRISGRGISRDACRPMRGGGEEAEATTAAVEDTKSRGAVDVELLAEVGDEGGRDRNGELGDTTRSREAWRMMMGLPPPRGESSSPAPVTWPEAPRLKAARSSS